MSPSKVSQDELDRRKVLSLSYLIHLATDPKKIVGVNTETVTNISSTDFPGHYPGEDHSWYLKDFKKVSMVLMDNDFSSNTNLDIPCPVPSE